MTRYIIIASLILILSGCMSTELTNQDGQATVKTEGTAWVFSVNALSTKAHAAKDKECNLRGMVNQETSRDTSGQRTLAFTAPEIKGWADAIKSVFGLFPINTYTWSGKCLKK